eukprot:14092401-Ditylum_brightwellii.AAC.1
MLCGRQNPVGAWRMSIPQNSGQDGSNTAWSAASIPSSVISTFTRTKLVSSLHLPPKQGPTIFEEATKSARDQLAALYRRLPKP